MIRESAGRGVGVLAGVLVGIVVGVGLGYLLFAEGEGHVEAASYPPAEIAVSPTKAGVRPAANDAVSAPRAVERREVEPSALPDRVARAVERTLTDLPEPPRAQGSGVISGQVVEPDGKGVAGVLVEVTRQSAERRMRRARPTVDRTLAGRVRRTVESYYRERAEGGQATSDDQGRFEIAGLQDGSYRITARRTGYEIRTRTGVWTARPGETVEIVADPLIALPVQVVLADGRPAARAGIECTSPQGNFQSTEEHAWSADEADLYLTAGRHQLRAVISADENHGLELASQEEVVRLRAGETPEPVVLQLRGRLGVTGRVTFPRDEAIESCQVHILPVPPGREPDLGRLRTSEQTDWVHPSRSTYSFMDLPPGTYVVGVTRGYDAPVSASAVVELEDRVVHQDLALPPLDVADALVVRVEDSTGAPLAGITFSMRMESANSSRSGGVGPAVLKDDEYYIIPSGETGDAWRGDWPEGTTFALILTTQDHGSKEVVLAEGQRRVTVVFAEPALLLVTVPGYVGSDYQGLLTLALRPASQDKNEWSYHSYGSQGSGWGADGTIELDPVEPGKYDIVMWLAVDEGDGFPSRVAIQETPVTLHAGKNTVTVGIPPLYPLTIQVPDGEKGDRIQLQPQGEGRGVGSLGGPLDENGEVHFDGLPAGSYQVASMGSGIPGIMTVTLPGPSRVVFQDQPINAMRVMIHDPDGTMAKAGLATGDLVIAINGKEFSNMIEIQTTLAGALSKKTMTMTVLRGEKRFEVEMDPRKMLGRGSGGSMEPANR